MNRRDAFTFLEHVRYKFRDQPQVYSEFLEIMRQFKNKQLDTIGVIVRVSTLFEGFPDLIQGFKNFLPKNIAPKIFPSAPPSHLSAGSGASAVSSDSDMQATPLPAICKSSNSASKATRHSKPLPVIYKSSGNGSAATTMPPIPDPTPASAAASAQVAESAMPEQMSDAHVHTQQQAHLYEPAPAVPPLSAPPAETETADTALAPHSDPVSPDKDANAPLQQPPAPVTPMLHPEYMQDDSHQETPRPPVAEIKHESSPHDPTASFFFPTKTPNTSAPHDSRPEKSLLESSQRSSANLPAHLPSSYQAPPPPTAASKFQTQVSSVCPSKLNTSDSEQFDAIQYVQKVKRRFINTAETYKKFLRILQMYRNSEYQINQVFDAVSQLFHHHPDLIEEFKKFLPEDTSVAAQGQHGQHGQMGSSFASESGANRSFFPHAQRPQQQQHQHHQHHHHHHHHHHAKRSSQSSDAMAYEAGHRIPLPSEFLKGPPTIMGGPPSNYYAGAMGHMHAPNAYNSGGSQYFDNKTSYNFFDYPPGAQHMQHHPSQQMAHMNASALSYDRKKRKGVDIPPEKHKKTKFTKREEEIGMIFHEIRNSLSSSAYDNFLKLIYLYSSGILDSNELLEYLPFESRLRSIIVENSVTNQLLSDDSDDDLTCLDKLGPSYLILEDGNKRLDKKCSGRSLLSKDILETLNNKYISHGNNMFTNESEEAYFLFKRKSTFEENMMRCEDELYELDLLIDQSFLAIKHLRYLLHRDTAKNTSSPFSSIHISPAMNVLLGSSGAGNTGLLPPGNPKSSFRVSVTPDPFQSTSNASSHGPFNILRSKIAAIKRILVKIYNEGNTNEILQTLFSTEKIDDRVTVLRAVLTRLEAKNEEWRLTKSAWFKNTWRYQIHKSNDRSLDMNGHFFKTSDKKFLNLKSIITDLEETKLIDVDLEVCERVRSQIVYTYIDEIASNLTPEERNECKDIFGIFLPNFLAVDFSNNSNIAFIMPDQTAGKDDLHCPFFDAKFVFQAPSTTPSSTSLPEKAKEEKENPDALHPSQPSAKINEADQDHQDQPMDDVQTTTDKAENPPSRHIYVNNAIYAFFRYFHLFFERILTIKKSQTNFELQETDTCPLIYSEPPSAVSLDSHLKDSALNNQEGQLDEPTTSFEYGNGNSFETANGFTCAAEKLGFKEPRKRLSNEECSSKLIKHITKLMQGDLDQARFEDKITKVYRKAAYLIFNIDKLLQNMIKQLVAILQDPIFQSLKKQFLYAAQEKTIDPFSLLDSFQSEMCIRITSFPTIKKLRFEHIKMEDDAKLTEELWNAYRIAFTSGYTPDNEDNLLFEVARSHLTPPILPISLINSASGETRIPFALPNQSLASAANPPNNSANSSSTGSKATLPMAHLSLTERKTIDKGLYLVDNMSFSVTHPSFKLKPTQGTYSIQFFAKKTKPKYVITNSKFTKENEMKNLYTIKYERPSIISETQKQDYEKFLNLFPKITDSSAQGPAGSSFEGTSNSSSNANPSYNNSSSNISTHALMLSSSPATDELVGKS